MKLKVTVASLALLMANNLLAQDLPYYDWEEISVSAEGALYGPFPVAISEDSEFIATYSMKASLSSNIDIGLPFTFNRACQYDYIVCELEFGGSETTGLQSYENAYKAWRNAQSNAQNGSYTSYMMGNVGSESVQPFDDGSNTTDIKVTDLYQSDSGNFVIGYSSASYSGGVRDFVRRAFIQSLDGTVSVQLLPKTFSGDNGGFSSAYKIELVDEKVFVLGQASVSYPRGDDEYFNDCYNSAKYDDRYGINELVNCPGFDTQAWVWDVTSIVNKKDSITELSGTALATQWIDNSVGEEKLTFSASAFDINGTGVAVGVSTFEKSNSTEGGRQRAIIMTPSTDGVYAKPVELTAATSGISDSEDWIYNTWALTVSEVGIITGNREYDASKGRNKATEFFVYDNETEIVNFPLLDKKVATTKQRNENNGNYYISKSGANSRVYDANEAGLIVGEVDDYDQVDPVYKGSPRSQTAFLYENETNQAWLINDLICSKDSQGTITSPRIHIQTARVIDDSGTVLGNGFIYQSDDDYKSKTNGVQTAFKLTRNESVTSANESPNCWESPLLKNIDEPYERIGAASFWLWLFALPLLFVRRFKR
ncbi:MAG: DUF3466 family protein [Alteromonadales bacterium]|nr:DUF3466 family protein [Alteromonadales bacterium]